MIDLDGSTWRYKTVTVTTNSFRGFESMNRGAIGPVKEKTVRRYWMGVLEEIVNKKACQKHRHPLVRSVLRRHIK